MSKRKYTYFDYDESERASLEKMYNTSMPEDGSDLFGKDIADNSSVKVEIIMIDEENQVAIGETPFGQSIVIDTKKEEKNLRKLGYPSIDLQHGQIIDVVVRKEKSGSIVGSLAAGYEKALKDELHKAIKDENCAFNVKVSSVCNGGFMVDLSGIQCFLPGSLAAANRIMNFADYVGKNLTVMVEIYDQRRDIFVVSFKKYLNKIIDRKVQDLSFCEKYTGSVTGASNSGIFVEWNEIFTGIIPFDDSNRSLLENVKTGDQISFYVTDIKNPQRISLSLNGPSEKLKGIQDLKDSAIQNLEENAEPKIYKGEITKLKTFGAFIKLENGLTGLIEKERLVNSIKDYEVGQSVDCSILSVDAATLKIQLIEQE